MTAKVKALELFIRHNHDASEAALSVREKISKGYLLWGDLKEQTEKFWKEVIDEIYKPKNK